MAKAPLLSKYLESFEKDPSSKVFAPLAESYRRLGMIGDAKKVLNKGFQYHPRYVPGLVTLAHCYFDEGQFLGAYDVLSPLVKEQYENYSLQKLFAFTCYELGKQNEALDTFKFLLFINPKDSEAAQKVSELEEILAKELAGDAGINIEESVFTESSDATDEDSWSQMDFSNESIAQDSLPQEINSESRQDKDSGEYFEKNEPVITHTLVDLYLNQKLHGKALEVLEKILELSPDDQPTREKYDQVKALLNSSRPSEKSLMDFYDEKFTDPEEGNALAGVEILERRYEAYLRLIKEKR